MSWVLVYFLVYFLFPTLLRWLLVYKGRSCLGINLVKSFAHPSRLIRVSWCLGKPRSWWEHSRHYLMFWSTIFHLKQLHLFIGITEYRNQLGVAYYVTFCWNIKWIAHLFHHLKLLVWIGCCVQLNMILWRSSWFQILMGAIKYNNCIGFLFPCLRPE